MSIRKKLILSFVFIVVTFLIIGITNYLLQTNYKKQLDIVSDKLYEIEKKSQKGKLLIKEILLDVVNRNRIGGSETEIFLDVVDKKAIEFYKNIDSIIDFGETKNEKLKEIRELFQQFYILSKRVSKYISNSEINRYPDTLSLYYSLEKKLQALIDQTFTNYEKEFESALKRLSENGKNTIYVSSILILYGIFFSIFVFFLLIRTIMRPIKDLLNTISSFDKTGEGQAKIFRDDEFGKMAESFNQLSIHLKENIKNLKSEVKDRKNAENDILKLKNILSNTIDSMPSILIGVNENHRVTQWNAAAAIDTDIKNKRCSREKTPGFIPPS